MKTKSILIVDDETNIRMVLRMALQSEGYTIREATNGREALASIERERADLMILDLSMPLLDGMGVLEALEAIRPEKKPRIIMLTAYGSISIAVKATRLGAADFLEKPVSPEEVRESVEAILGEPLPTRFSTSAQDSDSLSGGYSAVLDRIRKSLRLANYTDAETLLMKVADLAQSDADYFNLLGVLYESQREWRPARKFYGKALSLERNYEPAQKNLR